MNTRVRKIVGAWLLIGLVLVFVQVILGGITRLTDSGLSITEWNLVKGVLPPLNESEWQISFDKYKDFAQQQYENLHSDMTLSEFKKIYFWEWFHRLWARSMGFVFLFPFLFFLSKKWLPKPLLKKLAMVIFLAAIAASIGWIMVASGLENENRTWVSAYKLSFHLGIAALLFSYLFSTVLFVLQSQKKNLKLPKFRNFSRNMMIVIFIQILLGGLMAGMRAGSIHMHFPFFMGDNALVDILSSNTSFTFESVINYESNNFIKALVQVFHRSFAWIIFAFSFVFYFKIKNKNISENLRKANKLSLVLVLIQFLLGVFTILNYSNKSALIPLGILHQSFAFILLLCWQFIHYQLDFSKK